MANKKSNTRKSTRARSSPAKKPGAKKPAAKKSSTARQPQRTGAAAEETDDFPIVGVGASAGGLEALKSLLDAMPDNPGVALVIIQHLDPTKPSLTAELLDKHTAMNVAQVNHDVPVEPDHVYVIPPNKSLAIESGTLRLSEPRERRGVRVPIDFFLRSLADDQRERAVAVILSGTGTDGTLGAKAVKSLGGLVIVQRPATAAHAGMPRSAIETGIVDRVLPPAEIPAVLAAYARHDFAAAPEDELKSDEPSRTDLSAILALLRTRANFDFRCYKDSTLQRRARRRMGLLGMGELTEYHDYLREHDDEVRALLKDLLISVTDFFRDADAWKTLERKVIVPAVENKGADEPFRVWVPGCATGEEALSVAMLIDEQLQAAEKQGPLQIFASDVDKEALDYARQGRYPLSIASDVSAPRLKRFFVEVDGDHHYQVKKNLREQVVFAEQNLIADPPFSNLDLVCCRNLLIYLKPEIQRKLIALFHFALRDGGCLFLGNAETIGGYENLFETVSKKWRIYRRVGATRHDIVDFPVGAAAARREVDSFPSLPKRREVHLAHLAQQRLIDWIAPQAVLLDRQWQILYFSGDTDPYLTHSPGSATQDVLAKCRPGLRTKLRAVVQKALDQGETVSLPARVERDGQFCPLRLTARPVRDQENNETLVLVLFEEDHRGVREGEAPAEPHDSAEQQKARREPRPPSTDFDHDEIVRHLENELAETKEDLQTTIEQLEASNEEFKASSEEVMSINEELQSTNEELETSKEELQSMNEELNTVNSQLANKVEELESSNNDLNNLIRSTEIATICLDREMRIKWFTPATSDLMNIVATDVGRPLADFSHKLANENLLADARRVLDHLAPIEAEISVAHHGESAGTTARRGRRDEAESTAPEGHRTFTYLRRIRPYRTQDERIDGVVITLVDITERKRAQSLTEAKELAERIIDTVREPMLVLDPGLTVVSANESFYRQFHLPAQETIGQPMFALGDNQWDIPRLRELLEEVLPENHAFADFEVDCEFESIGHKIMMLNARRIERHELILLAIEDVTALKESERQNVQRVELLDILHDVAEAANKAQTVEQAMRAALRRICEFNGWRLGHVWRLADDGQQLESSGIWHCDDSWPRDENQARDLAAFQKICAETRIAPGEGLIGRVVQTGRPQWIEDVSQFDDWQRTGVKRLGLGAAIAFPVTIHSEVAAVIEFVSDKAMPREERFMEIMPSIGLHLGYVKERRRLEKMIADATTAQQRHFGRELHDSVSQELTGIGMLAETLRQTLSDISSPLAKQAQQLTDHLRVAHEQVSRLSRGLMPVDVDAEGLMAALEELVGHCDDMYQAKCEFHCDEPIVVEDNNTATHLYRIAQEAIQNANKHGRPKRIDVRLHRADGEVRLTIEDDGRGLPPGTKNMRGTGLRIMQYRANLIGARLEINSNPGQGVTVRCQLKVNDGIWAASPHHHARSAS